LTVGDAVENTRECSMNWLVTGANGYLGRHVVDSLESQDIGTIGIDVLGGFGFESKQNCYLADYTNFELLKEIHARTPIHGIIHLAARKSVAESMLEPDRYLSENYQQTIELIENGKSLGVENFIFASTAAVYGNTDSNDPVDELGKTLPTSPYGESKLLVEKWLFENHEKRIVNSVILRFFNLIGSSLPISIPKSELNVLPILAKCVLNSSSFNIYGIKHPTLDGTCVRDYIDVRDAAKVINLMSRRIEGIKDVEVFNVGSGRGTSVRKILNVFEQSLNTSIETNVKDARLGDVAQIVSNPNKIAKFLEWTPEYSVEESIKSYVSNLSELSVGFKFSS
jgi:UDP-glucose 4-epimerase